MPDLALAPFEVERDAVHAPAPPAGLPRAVVEDVAEVGAAARAADLGARRAVGAIIDGGHGLRRDGLGEARRW